MIHETNWLPGALMIALGVAAGVMALLFTRGRSAALGGGRDVKLADLEHRVSFLLEQLRALETERHQLGEERFAQDKAKLELEAAEALRSRDAFAREIAAASAQARAGAGVATPAAATQPKDFAARHPQLVGALWGAGLVGFFVALGFVLMNAQSERGNGELTGGGPSMTSNGAGAGAGAGAGGMPAAQEDPVFKMALERAEKNPGDLEASSFAVHELIRLQQFDKADKITRQALAADPFHLETRIHHSVLRATEGHFDQAVEELGNLAKLYPGSHEALLFRGALAMQSGKLEIALESFERFASTAPAEEQPPQIQSAIAMLRQRLGR